MKPKKNFYNLLLEEIKRKNKIYKFSVDKIEKRCLKGIAKFDKKLLNIYKNDIKIRYADYKIIVFLCYDTDVFQISQNPPVDWIDVEKKLYDLGASNVYHIKADKCIEDLFLLDI